MTKRTADIAAAAIPPVEAPGLVTEPAKLSDETCARLQVLVDAVDELEAHLDGLGGAVLDEVARAIQVCEATMGPARNMADNVHRASVAALHDFKARIEDKLVPATKVVAAAAQVSTDAINEVATVLHPLQQQVETSTADLIHVVDDRAAQLTTGGSELQDLTHQLLDEVCVQVIAVMGGPADYALYQLEQLEQHTAGELARQADHIGQVAQQQFVQPMQRLLEEFRSEIESIETQLRQSIASCGDRFAAEVTQFVDAQLAGVYAEIDSTVAKLEQRFELEATNHANVADGSRSCSDMLDGVFREAMGKLPIVKEIGGTIGFSI